ncbi:hypothetical protein Pla52o_41520 [Novipirellula galeiformis]|uniref:Uncharacterized protein n=1 Tax=Novipirellula galeiformis TaxID=2528004 RepID=A0A5C6CA92_9BACT|nr:hypothetical protein Pla52o_41520 [Novipirellula galeiformis]
MFLVTLRGCEWKGKTLRPSGMSGLLRGDWQALRPAFFLCKWSKYPEKVLCPRCRPRCRVFSKTTWASSRSCVRQNAVHRRPPPPRESALSPLLIPVAENPGGWTSRNPGCSGPRALGDMSTSDVSQPRWGGSWRPQRASAVYAGFSEQWDCMPPSVES